MTCRDAVFALAAGAALVAGCAGVRRGTPPAVGPGGLYEATADLPPWRDVDAPAERDLLRGAEERLERAEATSSAEPDRSRAGRREAAATLLQLAEATPPSRWQLVYLRASAEQAARAGDAELAARAAAKLRDADAAGPASRAIGARLAADALEEAARARARSGEADPLQLTRLGRKVRAPAEAWQRFVAAADLVAVRWRDDPTPGAAEDAARLALVAAEVAYAHGDAAQARRRVDALVVTWPDSTAAVDAARLELLTTPVRDEKAYAAAVDRVRARLSGVAARAGEAASRPDATATDKERASRAAAVLKDLEGERDRAGYLQAQELLRARRPAEAAAAFEAFVKKHPASPDAPSALYNAGVAYAQARQPKKAEAARTRLLERYPSAPEAGNATAALATARLGAGDARKALKLYDGYLARWPDGEQRCLVLANAGAALEALRRPLDAAARYRQFGGDARCAGDDPDTAARALVTAGKLYAEGHRAAEAKAAFQAALEVVGVQDAAAQAAVAEARRRLGGEK